MGIIATISETVVIIQDFFLGFIFDHFGRKLPIVFAFIILGFSVILIPVFDQIKYYYLLRIIISIGASFGLNVPLLPDYV